MKKKVLYLTLLLVAICSPFAVADVENSIMKIGNTSGASAVFIQGQAAHDAVTVGNPVALGAEARLNDITPVANGDVVKLIADLVGKLIVLPYDYPQHYVRGDTGTQTTATTVDIIAAQGAGVRTYITEVTFTNTSGTSITLNLLDGASVVKQVAVKTNESFSIVFTVPLRGSDNTAWRGQSLNAVTNWSVNASGYISRN